jgi:hypothetical protein
LPLAASIEAQLRYQSLVGELVKGVDRRGQQHDRKRREQHDQEGRPLEHCSHTAG